MSTSLQDVLDRVGAHPERYGRGAWYRSFLPWCPLAVEVLGSDFKGYECRDILGVLAKALGCATEDVISFTMWWDLKDSEKCRTHLESRGFVVPPDTVRLKCKPDPRPESSAKDDAGTR